MPHFSVRLSDDENRRLRALLEARGVSRSQWLRAVLAEEEQRASGKVAGEVVDDQELEVLLSHQARGGTVSAMKLLLDLRARRGGKPPAEDTEPADDDELDDFDALDRAAAGSVTPLRRRAG